jgi:putative endonuclease
MAFFVYILYSASHDIYYVGQTSDLAERIKRHNSGSEKFTSPCCPWVLKCSIEKKTRSEAVILEKKLKNLNREKLIKFINKYSQPGRDAALPVSVPTLASAFEPLLPLTFSNFCSLACDATKPHVRW